MKTHHIATTDSGEVYELETVTDRLDFPEGPVAWRDGSVVVVEIAGRRLTEVSPTGQCTTIATFTGSPNGAALGPDGAMYICNNGGSRFHREPGSVRSMGMSDDYSGGRIERVDMVTGQVTTLYDRCGEHALTGPNDLVFDRHGGFYFSDLGKIGRRTRGRGGVYYARADGSSITELVFGMTSPNGMGLSPDERTLYVADTEGGRLWAWDIESPGRLMQLPHPSPNGGRLVYGAGGYQRFDSLALEANGKVCVATVGQGCVTVIDPRDGFSQTVGMPDRHTTNICFGGPDLQDAFITQSSTGMLLRTRWPRAGLRLNYAV
ncbi:SMP-30/gluconolactonase/LRE family protein [Hydrogenophaga sp. BPS33]|uniref:SMP-30/gluconolactonase/LRE family protein n=1 Tax=Hydrogenophaga sp. BPS33 TaxID=2651974 RepID=UPI00131F6FF9|nr:SMP-30/gluconolactonase/LRE family protein [Hydrogenophaga sp. BPS33]QHE85055.1 SMP-30/gluconolactonase/LRE family protein [Hydrogenophaga sp. BPS33]